MQSMPQIVRKATDQFGHLHLYVAFLLVQNPEQLQPLMGVRKGLDKSPNVLVKMIAQSVQSIADEADVLVVQSLHVSQFFDEPIVRGSTNVGGGEAQATL